MAGRMYAVTFENVAVTAAQDFFEILPADDKPVIIHRVVVTQFSDTDSEGLRFTLKRLEATVTSGSGGSAATARPLNSHDAAAGATVEINNTSRASSSANTYILHAEGQNILSGWDYHPTPEERITFYQGEGCIIGLEAAPADSLSMSGVCIFEEL